MFQGKLTITRIITSVIITGIIKVLSCGPKSLKRDSSFLPSPPPHSSPTRTPNHYHPNTLPQTKKIEDNDIKLGLAAAGGIFTRQP